MILSRRMAAIVRLPIDTAMTSMTDILKRASREAGISLSAKALTTFDAYYHELLLWNARISLVSTTSPREVAVTHVLDSLSVVPFIPNARSRILDIGSGAGFPGIPLKIAMEDLSVTLVESSRKKSSFLKHVVRTLGLTDVAVINDRTESLARDAAMRQSFDVVVSRATFTLGDFLTTGLCFLAPGGSLIAMRGRRGAREIKDAAAPTDRLGLALMESRTFTLPVTGDTRTIVRYSRADTSTRN